LAQALMRGTAAADDASARVRVLAEQLRVDLDRLARALSADVDALGADVTEAVELTQQLRLMPAQSMLWTLARAVRDAAQALGKSVELTTNGGDVQLDAQVLATVRDALVHVVRNAVVHGIEPAAARRAANKPERGSVRLDIARRGSQVVFCCRDDGRGIDIAAVRAAAVARGALSAAADDAAVLDLLRSGGLSTQPDATELAGRGIGMDVVRATAAQLKGSFALHSAPGAGVTVELVVPITIAGMRGLIVEAGGRVAAVPIDAVQRTARIGDGEVARAAGGWSIVSDGEVMPFIALERALRRDAMPARRAVWSTVVVRAADRHVAVGVDRLLGTSGIVMRPLPALVRADPVVAGAALDPDGTPQLVLDTDGLLAAALAPDAAYQRPTAPARLPILVVDDSLTTRMLEQSILESAGYAVEVATSAEEALDRARARAHALFVVDVEMPGMDGFGFVAATRADAQLRDTPAILVTSRDAAEDRRRGLAAGARAYIVKGEFDQGLLLETIRGLLGDA
jgi:two-component system chemotaxis sensor kinase CheA